MRNLNKEQLLDIAHGACLLGSGGGGGLDMAINMIETTMTQHDSVSLVPVAQAVADEDKLTCVVSFAGSPKSGGKASAKPAIKALEEMNRICLDLYNKPIAYTIPLETGAVNSIVPFMAAKELDLAVVDADGAGRAVPELTHCTYATVAGLSMNPTVMGARDGHTVILKFIKYRRMKSILSVILTTEPFARIGGMAIWAIPSTLLEQAVPIQRTLSLCEKVGQALRGGQASNERRAESGTDSGAESGVEAALKVLNENGRVAIKLFKGTIHWDEGGSEMYDTGRAVIRNDQDTAHIYIQNENLIAWSANNTKVIGMMPDSLCYVTTDGMPLSNAASDGAEGKEIYLLGVAAEKELLQPEILNAYKKTLISAGYAGPYVPLPKGS